MVFKLKNIFPFLKTLKPVKLSVIIFSLFALSACSDDPVTPQEPEFDPPRFEWRSMEIPSNGFAGIWAKDTGNIFLLNHYSQSLYKISKGSISNFFIGNFYLNEIKGVSNSEIYLFGTNLSDQNFTIVKWDGSSFGYYSTNITIQPQHMFNIKSFVQNSNEIWSYTQSGIIRFDGINTSIYHLNDSNSVMKSIFMSDNNRLQYISIKNYENGNIQQTLYEFNGMEFIKVFTRTNNSIESITFLEQVNGMKFGLEYNRTSPTLCYQNFSFGTFTSEFCFDSRIIVPWIGRPAYDGQTKNNFMFVCETAPEIFVKRVGLIYLNGNRVSAEISLEASDLPDPYYKYIVSNIDENYNLLLCPYFKTTLNSTLYIGRKK